MGGTLALWCWALAALLFGLIAVAQLRHAGQGLPRRAFIVALSATALWALAVAGIDNRDLSVRIAEAARILAWLGFMWALTRRAERRERAAVAAVYGVVAMVVGANVALAVIERIIAAPGLAALLTDGRLVLRMMVAVTALVLTHHLQAATGGRRGGPRLVIAALGAMWAVDLGCYALAYLFGWSGQLVVVRGLATLLLAPVLAIAAHRDGDWTLQISRTVTYQSLTALALALIAGGMLLVTGFIAAVGGAHARLLQIAFVVGSTTALLTLAGNPWLRAWVRVKLAKHLFRHRYDYRAEWVRFTDTLGVAGEGRPPLDRRIVKAVADLTDSPAGLLLVPDGAGLGTGAAWNWDERQPGGEPLARHLAATGRILELDAVRANTADPADRAALPPWLLAHDDAWAVVPLLHFGELAGAIVLARPPVDRALDWEDFDLLRIAGRQVASYLAEAGAQGRLAEAQRFDEFNRRFAFIMHDIKNLVSQLSLVARNAERHADNPAFRADMVATLKDSADRMNALLARLSQHHGPRGEPLGPVDCGPLVERVARARRAQHPILTAGAGIAIADAGRLEQLLSHLVQNAVEASAPEGPIRVSIASDAGRVAIEVADSGCGMTPAFVRDELFRPFHSSKPGGFGIGAFEARQLAESMGGRVDVVSREGEGTRFTVVLPAAPALEAAA